MQVKKGFTVVELLVVITVLLVVIAAVVPQLRVINRERKLREASQIFVSAIERASRKAKLDGESALILERNPRFVDGNGVSFAVTRIYIAADVPDYLDQFGQSLRVYVDNSNDTNVPVGLPVVARPLSHDPANGREAFRVGDTLNADGVDREITAIQEYDLPNSPTDPSHYANGILILTVDPPMSTTVPDGMPSLDDIGEYDEHTYRVDRQPRLDNSNFFDIPAGHVVDLRFSGPPLASDPTVNNFFTQPHCSDDDFVRLNFNSEGLIESVDSGDGLDPSSTPPGSAFESTEIYTNIHFLVSDDGLDLAPTENQLMFSRNLWVVASPVSGRISVSPIVANTGAAATNKNEYSAQVWNAQALVRQSQLANQ